VVDPERRRKGPGASRYRGAVTEREEDAYVFLRRDEDNALKSLVTNGEEQLPRHPRRWFNNSDLRNNYQRNKGSRTVSENNIKATPHPHLRHPNRDGCVKRARTTYRSTRDEDLPEVRKYLILCHRFSPS
jgi:hypothetical protein